MKEDNFLCFNRECGFLEIIKVCSYREEMEADPMETRLG